MTLEWNILNNWSGLIFTLPPIMSRTTCFLYFFYYRLGNHSNISETRGNDKKTNYEISAAVKKYMVKKSY